jgi:hypothetical protein
MLKLTSRFVLEILPYALSALIAAVVVPGFLSAQFHGAAPPITTSNASSSVNTVELVRRDHARFGPIQVFADKLPNGAQQ